MRRYLFLAWGLSISAGALWIRLDHPQDRSELLAALVYSEPFHVFAHTLLYGTLAWLAARRLPLRRVVPTVLALGVIQEAVQVLGVRAPGSPEVFDLGVDALAAFAMVGLLERWPTFPLARPAPRPEDARAT